MSQPQHCRKVLCGAPTREMTYDNHRLRMKALMCERRKAKAKRQSKVCDEQESSYSLSSESSKDSEEPVNNDEPESSSLSSPSSKELLIRSQRRSRLKRKLFGPVPSTSAKRKPEADLIATSSHSHALQNSSHDPKVGQQQPTRNSALY